MKVICNTTPLISLSAIDSLFLLETIYTSVIVPEAVSEEINQGGRINVPDLTSFNWIEIIPNILTFEERLLFQLDYGERQVILNAIKLQADLVLLDDKVARNIAEYLGINVKGTLGVLVEAKRKNIISSFRDLAIKMREQGIYFSLQLINEISEALKEA